MNWPKDCYRVGSHEWGFKGEQIPTEDDKLDDFIKKARKQIEPWLSAVFQADHLNLLVGSGLTLGLYMTATGERGGTGMDTVTFKTDYDARINEHAKASAAKMGRGKLNIEDQFRSALAVFEGLSVIDKDGAQVLKVAMDRELGKFLGSLLLTETGISRGKEQVPGAPKPTDAEIAERDRKIQTAHRMLMSFLMSFASRTASRERLHIFTTNYDRLIEYGCDLAGLRIIDRFVGALNPVFRASRVDVDYHYNPPGIRGEPRYMEGVVRLTKLHGSIDWLFEDRKIHRKGIPFGAPPDHSDVPKNPIDTVMIYPNPAKDVETTYYPYAELFRDFAAAICRPNAVVVTYGYGFGDDHINRVLRDMLTIPSTHLVIIAYSADDRLTAFLQGGEIREAQVTLLIGGHFASLGMLTEHYLPKPALDFISGRMTELLKNRPASVKLEGDSGDNDNDQGK